LSTAEQRDEVIDAAPKKLRLLSVSRNINNPASHGGKEEKGARTTHKYLRLKEHE